ncbi:MAG: hypothetical protein E7231_05125 [Cellulosilyticum sp.]|nr:hypothetical protein [Cellulosilyticum sp.]
MNAKAFYENNILKLTLEDDGLHTSQIEAAFYKKQDKIYIKEYQGHISKAEQIIKNFNRLMPDAFDKGDWENALLKFARICKESGIIWFLTGSACDAVRGIDVIPHDLDIEIFSKHWNKAQEVLSDYIVEPFIETNGWARDHFGRIVVEKTLVDVVADEKFDFPNYAYEPFEWRGYTLWLEPFMSRYNIERQRERLDRIEAFDKYIALRMGDI